MGGSVTLCRQVSYDVVSIDKEGMLIVDHFNKLSIKIIPPATILHPLQNRKYRLTHSEVTGTWFVSIGTHFSDITSKNGLYDVIQAEWTTKMGEYILLGKINMKSVECEDKLAQVRYMIYQKDLPKLIALIVEADKQFLSYHPLLLDAPIHIEFDAARPEFYQTLIIGTPRKFLIKESINI